MKGILLFGGRSYNEGGGWSDFLDEFPTVEAAKDHVTSTHTARDYGVGKFSGYYQWSGTVHSYRYDWAQIVVDGACEWSFGRDDQGPGADSRWVAE